MQTLIDIAGAFMGKALGDKRTSSFEETEAEKLVSDHELLKIAIALVHLDPDDDDEIWTARRLAPLARLDRAAPYFENGQVRWLAQQWASGALRGRPALTWSTPNPLTGRSRAETFAADWNILFSSCADSGDGSVRPLIDDAEEVMRRSNAPLPTLYLGAPDWAVDTDVTAIPARLH